MSKMKMLKMMNADRKMWLGGVYSKLCFHIARPFHRPMTHMLTLRVEREEKKKMKQMKSERRQRRDRGG